MPPFLLRISFSTILHCANEHCGPLRLEVLERRYVVEEGARAAELNVDLRRREQQHQAEQRRDGRNEEPAQPHATLGRVHVPIEVQEWVNAAKATEWSFAFISIHFSA